MIGRDDARPRGAAAWLRSRYRVRAPEPPRAAQQGRLTVERSEERLRIGLPPRGLDAEVGATYVTGPILMGGASWALLGIADGVVVDGAGIASVLAVAIFLAGFGLLVWAPLRQTARRWVVLDRGELQLGWDALGRSWPTLRARLGTVTDVSILCHSKRHRHGDAAVIRRVGVPKRWQVVVMTRERVVPLGSWLTSDEKLWLCDTLVEAVAVASPYLRERVAGDASIPRPVLSPEQHRTLVLVVVGIGVGFLVLFGALAAGLLRPGVEAPPLVGVEARPFTITSTGRWSILGEVEGIVSVDVGAVNVTVGRMVLRVTDRVSEEHVRYVRPVLSLPVPGSDRWSPLSEGTVVPIDRTVAAGDSLVIRDRYLRIPRGGRRALDDLELVFEIGVAPNEEVDVERWIYVRSGAGIFAR